MKETALTFECAGTPIVGVLHESMGSARRGVLIVVSGGPQYRVGGHRQLVLWARRLAEAGYPVMRFDHRGMGDSHGEFLGYDHLEDDIRTAADRFVAEFPHVDEVVLWGECDASSAILLYAHSDARVKGVVLLNPYAYTDSGEAQTFLRHYYVARLLEPEFWRKVFSGKFNLVSSITSLLRLVGRALSSKRTPDRSQGGSDGAAGETASLPDRMFRALTKFEGPVMLVMSGRDLFARRFDDLLKSDPEWPRELREKPTTRFDLPDADHTFSSTAQRDQVVEHGLSWLRSW